MDRLSVQRIGPFRNLRTTISRTCSPAAHLDQRRRSGKVATRWERTVLYRARWRTHGRVVRWRFIAWTTCQNRQPCSSVPRACRRVSGHFTSSLHPISGRSAVSNGHRCRRERSADHRNSELEASCEIAHYRLVAHNLTGSLIRSTHKGQELVRPSHLCGLSRTYVLGSPSYQVTCSVNRYLFLSLPFAGHFVIEILSFREPGFSGVGKIDKPLRRRRVIVRGQCFQHESVRKSHGRAPLAPRAQTTNGSECSVSRCGDDSARVALCSRHTKQYRRRAQRRKPPWTSTPRF